MTARIVPENPTFTTTSEREVWESLRDTLSEDDVLVANLRLTDEAKDHEADLIVLMPGVGIVVLEVKGGSVWFDEGGWHRSAPGGRTRDIHPVDQARDGKYAVRQYVERDLRWRDSSRPRVVWAHAVVTPYSSFDADFAAPDCPRWSLHDRADMVDLAERLRDCARKQQRHYRPPSHEDVDLIVDILQGRRHTTYDVNAESEERAAEAERLTSEQATILHVTRLLNRVEVRGGAGSGKTVLALTQARELTRGRSERRPQRAEAAAGGVAVLLDRSRGAFQARGRDVEPEASAGIRGDLPRARPVLGRTRGGSDRQRVLGDRPAGDDGLAGGGAHREAEVRRRHRRRGPGLRRLVVAAAAEGVAR